MKYLNKLLKEYSFYIRLLAILLLIVTIILGILWCLEPNGSYEPWIFVIGTYSAILGVPSASDLINSHRRNESKEEDSISFLIRLGDQSDNYWDKVDTPLPPNKIATFEEQFSQCFQISSSRFVDDVDPSFDITLVNDLNSTLVVCELGVEIVSVAHEIKFTGAPQSSKILQQASYTIEIPNIRAKFTSESGKFPRLLEPRKINISLSTRMPDLFSLAPGSTFRYEILLKDYVANMPNHAVLRFWILGQKMKYTSDLIHIFTF